MTILVGDIGGTNARFAVVSADGRWEMLTECRLPSSRFVSLEDALSAFVDLHPVARQVTSACIGIAGPIDEGRCETTNLPWVVDSRLLAERLELPRVPLLNDLEAAAWGLDVLGPNGLRTLREGTAGGGNRALVAPGTGLGQAIGYWDGKIHHPIATEGGHADFGPASEMQVKLWRFMTRRYGHVSWERLVSGPGLVGLFEFLLDLHGKQRPVWLEEADEGQESEAITSRARDERCPLCQATIDLFFSLLGAEAGNLALKTLATGGVYLAGGIVPKLLTELMESRFLEAFGAKGRFRPLLESMPVRVVIDDRVALWGAAAHALNLEERERTRLQAVPRKGPPFALPETA
ncbi:MAG: glucokinase [Acidobacteriota bacterium]